MEKLKGLLKLVNKNQVKWIILVSVICIGLVSMGVTRIVSYVKEKEVSAKANKEEKVNSQETIIDQVNLVNTSNMSEEELKKLNEEELKKAEEEKKKKEEANKTTTTNKNTTKPSKNKYYIKVNYGAQTVNVYTYDKNGKYTVPVTVFVCSTGAATPTSGVYRMSWKATWGRLFGNVWGQYCTQIVGDILFHSVPYKQNRKDTLVSAYYDKLGTKDSMGCIRLTTRDALWIFNNCPSGTQVEFYSSSNPGPLGKPTAQKVSNAPGKLKNWDPTDPDNRNPWRTYKPADKKPENTQTNNTTNVQNTLNSNTQTKPGNNEVISGGNTQTKPGNNETTSGGNTQAKPGNNETTSGGNTQTKPGNNETTSGGNTQTKPGNNETTSGENTQTKPGNNETTSGGNTQIKPENNEATSSGSTQTKPVSNNEV